MAKAPPPKVRIPKSRVPKRGGGGAPRFGLGMSTGEVVFGAVGGLNQIRVGAIGDTLNLAARVESLTKRYRTAALIIPLRWRWQ